MKHTTFDPRNIIFLGTYRKMLVFYFWHGRYCVRTVSSLSGKRVKRAAEFKITMQYARRLGCASKVAAAVYRQLPDGWKLHDLYRKMTGLGASLLRERVYTTEELEMALWQYLASVGFKAEEHCVQHTVPVELKLPCVLPSKVAQPPKSLSRLWNLTGIAREKNNTAGRKKAIALRTHYLHSDTNDERNATQRSSIVLPPLVALYSTTLKENCNSS